MKRDENKEFVLKESLEQFKDLEMLVGKLLVGELAKTHFSNPLNPS